MIWILPPISPNNDQQPVTIADLGVLWPTASSGPQAVPDLPVAAAGGETLLLGQGGRAVATFHNSSSYSCGPLRKIIAHT